MLFHDDPADAVPRVEVEFNWSRVKIARSCGSAGGVTVVDGDSEAGSDFCGGYWRSDGSLRSGSIGWIWREFSNGGRCEACLAF